jgi:DNA repair photolyase
MENHLTTKVKEIQCSSAIGKCGFPGGGWAINPYIGCAHNCVYCYARFIKRFTGHLEPWGTFVDIRVNLAEVLKKQLRSPRYKTGRIFIGTVTDPYQQVENKYQITRKILEVLQDYGAGVSILTKSDLVLRDLDLLKQFKDIDVNFTITSFDEKWKKLTEPNSPTAADRLKAIKILVANGIPTFVMMGPFWPFFTDAEKMLSEFKKIGVSKVFTESFNTVGGNWTGVEEVLRQNYPEILPKMKEILFDKQKFNDFYYQARLETERIAKKINLPITVYFGRGHAAKFKRGKKT